MFPSQWVPMIINIPHYKLLEITIIIIIINIISTYFNTYLQKFIYFDILFIYK